MHVHPSITKALGALLLVAASTTGSALPPVDHGDPESSSSHLEPCLPLELHAQTTDEGTTLQVELPIGAEPATEGTVWLLLDLWEAGEQNQKVRLAVENVSWNPHLRLLAFDPPPHAPGDVSFLVRLMNGSGHIVRYPYPQSVAASANAGDPAVPSPGSAPAASSVPASTKTGTKRPRDLENQSPNLPRSEDFPPLPPAEPTAKHPRFQAPTPAFQGQAMAPPIPAAPRSLLPPLPSRQPQSAVHPLDNPKSQWTLLQTSFNQNIGKLAVPLQAYYRDHFQTAMAFDNVDRAIQLLDFMRRSQDANSFPGGTLASSAQPSPSFAAAAAASASPMAEAITEALVIQPSTMTSVLALHDRNVHILALLNTRQAAMNRREAELAQGQAEVDQRKAEVDQRQAELDQRQAELDQRQAELDQRQAELEMPSMDLSFFNDDLLP